MCLKGSKTHFSWFWGEKKYEGFNMISVEAKQTEIILDRLTNGLRSSDSILRQSGNSNFLYKWWLLRMMTITILRYAWFFFFFQCIKFSQLFNFSDRRPVTAKQTCQNSYYGCCPDGVTFARGSNYEGCTQSEDRPGIP